MSRSPMMSQLGRLARLAARCEKTGETAQEAIEQEHLHDAKRRRFMQGAAAAAATAAAGAVAPVAWAGAARLRRTVGFGRFGGSGGVAIVGAGLAGLSCAYELARNGVNARVYEANGRVGGRCWSLRGFFPGQVAERGAEFIGPSHHMMLGYARAFGLALEDFSMLPGAMYYHFDGSNYSEAQVVEEYRAFTESIRQDLCTLSYPTADRHTEDDALFDLMSLDDYLHLHGAGGMLRKVIGAAYAAEYGAGIDELSSISFLRFLYGDKRSKFAQVGAFGADQFHVVDGNDRIATALAERLPGPVQLGHRLTAVHRLSSGRIRLSFNLGGRSLQTEHDAVVLAVPFSVLRDVHLDSSLELPAWKRHAIDNAAMSDNAKLMVGFNQPYWYVRHGSNGAGFGDRARLQATWETNPVQGSETRAVLTAYAGGALAKTLDPRSAQSDAVAFLNDLEVAMPGAYDTVRRTASGEVLAHVENWSSNPFSRGGYTCNRPGYFTTIAHHEAKPVGNLLFAGEHTSSFYEWQGFMEGAALSGLRAANEAMMLSNRSLFSALAARLRV
ncbi:MAG: FAD-dependent oxidoreductase [Lysobacteraceae bacterium]|nr:MAG: FAD-dependent oxidoreductase [Xanthomonadaceae bacterium]